MDRFAEEWADYRSRVVHADAGSEQVKQTKMAFYAGSMATLSVIVGIADTPVNPTQMAADVAQIDGLYEEVKAVCESFCE